MDLSHILHQTGGLFAVIIVVYFVFIRKSTKRGSNLCNLLFARHAIRRWKSQLPPCHMLETPRLDWNEGYDGISLRASAPDGSTIYIGIRKVCGKKAIAEVTIFVKLSDGTTYRLPQHPETALSYWMDYQGGWSAGGLKIQELEPQRRLRILYNGVLTRVGDNKTHHVKLNLIWTSVAKPLCHPEDWNEYLAADVLLWESRGERWSTILDECGRDYGSWFQFGAIQGRFQVFNLDGDLEISSYIRVRGVRERMWTKGNNIRKTINISVAARDGTAVQIRGFSHKNRTEYILGGVRLPNNIVTSISSSDLILSDLFNTDLKTYKTYTINVTTSNQKANRLKIVLKIKDGGHFYTGIPHQEKIVYRTVDVDINDEPGTGIIELGCESFDGVSPSGIKPIPTLRWVSESEAGSVGYCVSLELQSAACVQYTGGKAASLALLTSVQKEQGYRVPPGFCITTKALEKHLKLNSEIRDVISDIEACNRNYDEDIFKGKCARAVELFLSTEIEEEIKNNILNHLGDLRRKSENQNFSTPLRFAVRSSGVGEDSEILSAAGQNETVLGCVSDEDVLKAVQKCWGSMFSFTSVYYRRQNGQPCSYTGGVVVQALVTSQVAGVIFTSHPPHGDSTRVLIAANYGLGESVVSGFVEPDTIVVRRELDGKLSIAKIDLGSKKQRIITSSNGIAMENVPDLERSKPCLSEMKIIKIAKIAVEQENLWGAGRDIEFAIYGDDIFLLQSRPITSIEHWTEEELLHEFDDPIMADNELLSFANTAEVLPKTMSSLTYDMCYIPFNKSTINFIRTNRNYWDKLSLITHNRLVLSLYNSIYYTPPKKMTANLRMSEMSLHGHTIADDGILKTAIQRENPTSLRNNLKNILKILKILFCTKRIVDDAKRAVESFHLNMDTNDPLTLLNVIAGAEHHILDICLKHMSTTTASSLSQSIAVSVLSEGKSEFSMEDCNEIIKILGSGDVLSAEIPNAIDKLFNSIEVSGKLEEFRKQNHKLAMSWLKTNLPRVYEEVCLFLNQHGYRAIMELDLITKPWSIVPEDFMKVLQQMNPTRKITKSQYNDDEVCKSSKKAMTRFLVRWLLPLCRRTLRHREESKAQLILSIHKVRLAVRHLATMMYHRWMIPDVELVFHFRLHELRQFLETRDPGLLRKAVQRQQYYGKWCKMKFSEINQGWVEPLKYEGPQITNGDVRIKATSICDGEVIARACVVKDFSEISKLQQGDILITHSTDIGWSPYFPMITGIVTELGGLISHGAVIARECGLPCLVGVNNATDVFCTGDTVRLSGDKGFIERVSVED